MAQNQHQKRKVRTVVGGDLLTAREKWIMGNIGGFYSMGDMDAFVKNSADKPSMTISEFEKYLKEKIHPNFYIVFNSQITPAHFAQGHQIFFHINGEGFIPVTKVGRSTDKLIPAMMQGEVVQYKESLKKKEKAVIWRGWVAAFEICKAAFQDWKQNGYIKAQVISPQEYFAMKKYYHDIIGGKSIIEDTFKKDNEKRLIDELVNKENNLKYFKDPNLLKYINIKDSNYNMFLTKQELEDMDFLAREKFFSEWRIVTEEKLAELIKETEDGKEVITKEIELNKEEKTEEKKLELVEELK